MNSVGTNTDDFTYGSSICSIRSGDGSFDGLSMSSTSPAVVSTLYCTLGAVTISERLNSRSSRSWTISMCSMPRIPQRLVIRVLDRVKPGEDHRLGVAIARERRGGGPRGLGDRLADLRVGDALDRRRQIADLSGRELLDRPHVRAEDADLLHVVRAAVGHQ